MGFYWILIVLFIISLLILVEWLIKSSKDFTEQIETELKLEKMSLLNLSYPGLFKVGPFKKIEISIGKPIINGAVQYENTYYRIVELKTEKNKTYKIWARIDTNWFKETKIKFIPKLNQLK